MVYKQSAFVDCFLYVFADSYRRQFQRERADLDCGKSNPDILKGEIVWKNYFLHQNQ